MKGTIETVFDWKYELKKQNLLNLYEKGKTLAWNANDLDWSIDVNVERMVKRARRQRHAGADELPAQSAEAAERRRGRHASSST